MAAPIWIAECQVLPFDACPGSRFCSWALSVWAWRRAERQFSLERGLCGPCAEQLRWQLLYL